MGLIANFFNRITGGGSSSGPKAQSVTVGNTTTGVVHTVTRLLGSTSTISLIGSTANLSVSDATILLAVAPDGGTSQNLSVRETNGYLAVEYPLSLVNTEAYASVFSLGAWNDAAQWRDSHIWSDGAYATITAPILTKTSTAGANPIAFTIALDNTVAPGMYWHLQVASDAGFTNILSDDFRLITLDDFNGSPQFNALKSMANGPTFVRLRIERDDGVMSSWSTVISDTLSGVPIVTFDPTNRNTTFTRLYDNNLRMTGLATSNAAGFAHASRSIAVGENAYAEFVLGNDQDGSGVSVGVADSSLLLTNTDTPGNGKPGLFYGSGGYIGWAGAPNYPGAGAPTLSAGDVVGVYIKNIAGGPLGYVSKNGVWDANCGNPSSGGGGFPLNTSGVLFATAGSNGGSSVIARFSAETQQYRGSLAPYGANANGTVPA